MDTKIIGGLVAVLVILGGAGYFFWSHGDNGVAQTQVASTTPSVSTSTEPAASPVAVTHGANSGSAAKKADVAAPAAAPKVAGVNTLAYLFSLKEPLICNVKTASSGKLSGVMYVAEDKMRGDFTNTTTGVSTNTSMINDGKYLYVWKSGTPNGLKLLAASSVSGSAIASSGGFDPETSLSFACNTWTENATFFVPPTSVTFSNNP